MLCERLANAPELGELLQALLFQALRGAAWQGLAAAILIKHDLCTVDSCSGCRCTRHRGQR